jgi:hypothetical protein
MRTSQAIAKPLAAGAIIAFLAGCGAGSTGGGSSFEPTSQTSSVRLQLARPSLGQPCPDTLTAVHNPGVPLASASSFGVLAGSTVTNAGPTIVNGNLGVYPGTAITGFGPGIVNGQIHAGDPVAAQAQADLAKAYNNAVARKNPVLLPADIGGMTLKPGLYNAPVSLGISGTVTLDGKHNPASVFIFQIPSTLTTSVNSAVVLTNEANPCSIYWQVGSSATLNTASVFSGTIMAQASISLGTGSTVNGRVLAESGAITLLSNTITVPGFGALNHRH